MYVFHCNDSIFRSDTRQMFFIGRVVKHCNKLPGEVVMVPSAVLFKKHLGSTLMNIWLNFQVALSGQEVVGPFQLRIFYDSVILKRAKALLTIQVSMTNYEISLMLKYQSKGHEPWVQILAANACGETFLSPGVKFHYDPQRHLMFVKRYYKYCKYFKARGILQRSQFSHLHVKSFHMFSQIRLKLFFSFSFSFFNFMSLYSLEYPRNCRRNMYTKCTPKSQKYLKAVGYTSALQRKRDCASSHSRFRRNKKAK